MAAARAGSGKIARDPAIGIGHTKTAGKAMEPSRLIKFLEGDPKAAAIVPGQFPAFAVRLFSTVWARRFCDQQEMSLHTATGRSLP